MSWSARQYTSFEAERTRPVRDLVHAIPTSEVRRAIDLGCGPGNSTEVLAERFASAEEIANFFVFLCSNKASYSTGSTYFVDGGWLKTV